MSSWHQPSTVTTDSLDSDGTCPGCDTAHGGQPQPAPPTVDARTCTACGLHWVTTLVNPTLRVALSVVGLLPTPQQRTAALLAVLHTEVTQRTQAREHTMAETICFPLDQVVQLDAMATVDTTLWRCQLCGQQGTARTTPQATSDAIAHLGSNHNGVADCPSERKRTPGETPASCRLSPIPCCAPGGRPVPTQDAPEVAPPPPQGWWGRRRKPV